MIKTITLNDFIQEFENYGRQDQFSIYGLEALFEYYEEVEEDINEPIELDVISICCDWAEYEKVGDFLNDYGYESLEEAEDHHYIIYLANDNILVEKY